MSDEFTPDDRRKIREGLLGKYAKVAQSPSGLFKYPTGRDGLEKSGYNPKWLGALPEAVLESFCGVGNPFSAGPIHPGDHVLDIGCGAGVDAFIAGMLTGPNGMVIGIDASPDMIAKAERNLAQTSLTHVRFQEGSAEELPFESETFDVVISSGVFNLVPDKAKALREVFRALKPGGSLLICDQTLTAPAQGDAKARVDSSWAG
jgi:SAM-dependent methyltransferase